MLAAVVCDLFVQGAKNRDSALAARVDQQRRHSGGEGTAAASTMPAAGDIQTPKGSAQALSGVASAPQGGHGRHGQVLHHEELPQQRLEDHN
jgi:hypothetical protein